ncbi:hypothetical protein GQX73_g6272 [Xylaria multiplex]|uniref:Prion-inhibition and propagation HeLo domain-containing protein n=1 Tax=Xylaria multiplex TaxID=323545 RepID=A0A7C8IN21_9PEZI|nr:hypothetical protein GQX73_g6272 [Xylaria multiplex]
MEVVGLGVGVIGLAGLFSTCLDLLERWDSFQDFGRESGPIRARFIADCARFRQWGQHTGIGEGKREGNSHQALDDPSIRSAVELLLLNIKNIEVDAKNRAPYLGWMPASHCSQPKNNTVAQNGFTPFETSRRNRLGWALRSKARTLALVAPFETLVQKLYDLIPVSETTIKSQVAIRESQGQQSASTGRAAAWKDDAQRILFDFEKQIHNETRKELSTWPGTPMDTKRTYEDFVLRRLNGTCDWIQRSAQTK